MEEQRADRRLIRELSQAPSASYSQLARRTSLSTDQVRYAIAKFLDEGLIYRFYTLIPLAHLGCTHYTFRYRLRAANAAKMAQFLEYLRQQPRVTWVAQLEGPFDVAISLRCFDVTEVTAFSDDLLESFNDSILERSFGMYVSVLNFGRRYLGKQRDIGRGKDVKHEPALDPSSLDRLDLAILENLSLNCRMRATEIADSVCEQEIVPSITREAIDYRIKKLKKAAWIAGEWLVMKPVNSLFSSYKIAITLDDSSASKLQAVEEFCRESVNVVKLYRVVGGWDIEIDFEAEQHSQPREFMMRLTESIPNLVRDYSLTELRSFEKWDTSQILSLAALPQASRVVLT